ncbi:hypothetical protein [Pseudoduganella namucuonensis]|nr:hypothetical protein [Pseudoduganella namucuonensis]
MSRDKLAMLRNSKEQAFFAAPMVNFPTLGRDFVDWFCGKAALPFPLQAERVWPLFVEAGPWSGTAKPCCWRDCRRRRRKPTCPARSRQALIALHEKKLVWRAARGVYIIEEQSIVDLLAADGLLDGLA